VKVVPFPVAAWNHHWPDLAGKSDPQKAQDDRGLARIILIPPG